MSLLNKSLNKQEIKLLVVDDREDNLFSIETILEKDGYIIRKANSGRAALKTLLKEVDFTLILMDVQMPDLNGFETANLIYQREKLRHIPIIFITADNHGDENVFKGYEMGGVDYIYKPINAELLRAKVAVFVELYQKNHQLMMQEQHLIMMNQHLQKEIQERIISEEKVKQLNSRLIENIRQLKAKNEELDRFAYIASHDLQEPLRKIRTFGDRLVAKLEAINDDARQYLNSMLKASERMQLLINDILAYSRFSSASYPLVETDLNRVVKEVLSDLEVFIEQKNAQIAVGLLPHLPVVETQIRQLFQNLISNALKFSDDTRPLVISISADKITPKAESANKQIMYHIHVKDNGIGFDPKFSEEVFVLFKRLHGSSTYSGTGIGLTICKKIVEKHNGNIYASSEPGKGTCFTIELPAQHVDIEMKSNPSPVLIQSAPS